MTLASGKSREKAEQDANIGAAPAVNGLVFVANHADVVVRADQQTKKIVLHAIGVLIFVDVDVLEAALPLFADRDGFAQKLFAVRSSRSSKSRALLCARILSY